jgi:hypothetical protein
MKAYSISVSINIHDKASSYPEVRPIDMSIKENLPANVDPHKYLRQRVAEELKRHFDQLSVPIENRSEDAPEDDPLSS